MDGRMDKFVHAHMPELTEVFHYLIPTYYTWDQWLLSTFHQRIQKHMLTFSILSVPMQIYTGFIITLNFGLTFSGFFFKSSQPKIFRVFIIGLLKHVILFSILSEIISSNGWILSCNPEGFISAVKQRKVLILPNYDTFSFLLVCFIIAQEIYTFLEGFDKGTLLSRWQEKQS